MIYKTLNNNVEIPILGLGTYKIGNTEAEVYNAIRTALDAGFRHIDTATLYENEKPIGKAIRESGVAREDIFVTTKLWGTDVLKNNVQGAFDESMRKLDVGYIDLYLVHWPVVGKLPYAWQEMEKIYSSEKARAIGVSNYMIHHLKETLETASVVPAVNQVELHPYLVQQELVDFCFSKNILPEAWSPLGSKKVPLLENPLLIDLSAKYDKTPAQIVLRWNVEKDIVVIPKSSSAERQQENLAVFDFELSAEDVQAINELDKDYRTGVHPDEIGF